MRRKFCFTQQQLIDRALNLYETCKRDMVLLQKKGFSDENLNRMSELTKKFEAFNSDSSNLQNISKMNTYCKNLKKEIVRQIRVIQWQLESKGLAGNEYFVLLKNLKVHNVSEEIFLMEIRKVQGYSVKLCSLGISASMTGALSQQIIDYKTNLDNFHKVIDSRKTASEHRISLANELTLLMSQICKIGKLLFKGVDDTKYKDSILYPEKEQSQLKK